MEVDSDISSDSDGHGDNNNQEAIVIPITKRNDPAPVEGCNTENGVTIIYFAKSEQVVCEKCFVSLKSMKCLEKHMKDKHSDNETCFFCSKCGISKATKKQLLLLKNEMIYNTELGMFYARKSGWIVL